MIKLQMAKWNHTWPAASLIWIISNRRNILCVSSSISRGVDADRWRADLISISSLVVSTIALHWRSVVRLSAMTILDCESRFPSGAKSRIDASSCGIVAFGQAELAVLIGITSCLLISSVGREKLSRMSLLHRSGKGDQKTKCLHGWIKEMRETCLKAPSSLCQNNICDCRGR